MRKISISNEFFITIFLPRPILLAIALLFGRLLSTKQLLHNYNLEKYAEKWCYVQFNGK
jgi:hypothetical protein